MNAWVLPSQLRTLDVQIPAVIITFTQAAMNLVIAAAATFLFSYYAMGSVDFIRAAGRCKEAASAASAHSL